MDDSNERRNEPDAMFQQRGRGRGSRRPPRNPQPGRIRVTDAIIEQISFDRGDTFVTIVYREPSGSFRGQIQTVRLVVNRRTTIRDEFGRQISVRELQEGMIVDAVFSAAMTRSIPPQAEAFQIVVVRREQRRNTTEGRIVQIDNRAQFITTITGNNPSSIIRFNVTPSTLILDPLGRRISLRNLVPGLRVRVHHAAFMTASIPPQTTAFEIRVIR